MPGEGKNRLHYQKRYKRKYSLELKMKISCKLRKSGNSNSEARRFYCIIYSG